MSSPVRWGFGVGSPLCWRLKLRRGGFNSRPSLVGQHCWSPPLDPVLLTLVSVLANPGWLTQLSRHSHCRQERCAFTHSHLSVRQVECRVQLQHASSVLSNNVLALFLNLVDVRLCGATYLTTAVVVFWSSKCSSLSSSNVRRTIRLA